MIDKARELQDEISQFELDYNKEVEKALIEVETKLVLDPPLKSLLINQLQKSEATVTVDEPIPELSREKMIELMQETSIKLSKGNSNPLFFKSSVTGQKSEQGTLQFKPFG
jgi:hypothetical protein